MAQELPPCPPLVRITSDAAPSFTADTPGHSSHSAVVGAVTNLETPIYLGLLATYASTIDNLNIGAALMVLLLGLGNIFNNPLLNSKQHVRLSVLAILTRRQSLDDVSSTSYLF